jgi:hypothetical protein
MTSFTICSIDNQTIQSKLQTLVDDNIQIKNNEKNNMLTELGNLSKDEQVSNKVLKQLKLKRWATPANLRAYTKSGYDKDNKDTQYIDTEIIENIVQDVGNNDDIIDGDYAYEVPVQTENEETVGDEMNWEVDPGAFINDMGDADYDGDYYNVEYNEG